MSDITSLQNAQRGRHVYVVGKGPSALEMPDDDTLRVGVNNIELDPGIRVDYCVIMDAASSFAFKHGEDVPDRVASSPSQKLVARPVLRSWTPHLEKAERTAVSWMQAPILRRQTAIPDFYDTHPSAPHVPTFNGCTFAATMIAIWMGATTITLWGADYTAGGWHGGCKFQGVKSRFRLLRKFAEARGRDVRVGSETSRLAGVLEVR